MKNNLKCWDWYHEDMELNECIETYNGNNLTDMKTAMYRLKNDPHDNGERYCVVEERVLCKINLNTHKIELIYKGKELERLFKLEEL